MPGEHPARACVDRRAGEEAERRRDQAAALACLGDQLEGQRRGEDARAERHDRPDHPPRHPHEAADERAEDQRRPGEESPEAGLQPQGEHPATVGPVGPPRTDAGQRGKRRRHDGHQGVSAGAWSVHARMAHAMWSRGDAPARRHAAHATISMTSYFPGAYIGAVNRQCMQILIGRVDGRSGGSVAWMRVIECA